MRSVVAALSVGAVLIGCAPSAPSEDLAKGIFAIQLRGELGSTPFVVETFEKTNGQQSEQFGVPVYTLWYKATVRYPEGIRPECVSSGNNTFSGWNCVHFMTMGGTRPQPRDALVTQSGTIAFEKTERGWRPAQ